MWRVLIIASLVLQQTLAAWLVPVSAAPAPKDEAAPAPCCCCQAACDAIARECNTESPRRCAPTPSTQRPLNSDAANTRTITRIAARVAENGNTNSVFRSGNAAQRAAGIDGCPASSLCDSRTTLDARTRRAFLCVRTT